MYKERDNYLKSRQNSINYMDLTPNRESEKKRSVFKNSYKVRRQVDLKIDKNNCFCLTYAAKKEDSIVSLILVKTPLEVVKTDDMCWLVNRKKQLKSKSMILRLKSTSSKKEHIIDTLRILKFPFNSLDHQHIVLNLIRSSEEPLMLEIKRNTGRTVFHALYEDSSDALHLLHSTTAISAKIVDKTRLTFFKMSGDQLVLCSPKEAVIFEI